ncbi:MAG: type II/IV secretion system protein, partial [Chloroflexota bacterium]|nr:type II/IV secretion system protein [Chloroflexota bacterium]
TLVGIVAQRIIRRICPHCRAMARPSLEEHYAYYEEMTEERGAAYKGTGCEFCGKTGYLGRIGVYECLVMSGEIRRMLLARSSPGDIRAEALREGLVTMKRDGMLKVKKGITTSYEVMRNVFSID